MQNCIFSFETMPTAQISPNYTIIIQMNLYTLMCMMILMHTELFDCLFTYNIMHINKHFNSTYTFCVNWVCGKEDGSKQRGLRSVVQYPPLLIVGQSTNKYCKHVNHKGGYDSMEEDVQHMEANGVKASRYEVVQPATARQEKN